MPTEQQDLSNLLSSPTSILLQVIAVIPIHIASLAISYFIVSGLGKRPFLKSLGWDWKDRNLTYQIVFTIVIVGLIFAGNILIAKFVPDTGETAVDRIVKSSLAARTFLSVLAVISAPFIEEVLYRGIIYSGLCKYFGAAPSIVIVTFLFAGLHYFQYWENPAAVVSITLVSLILTLTRAMTKSLKACVLVHTLFNFLQVILPLLGDSAK